MKDFSFYLVTDPHYYDSSFKRTGSAYEERSKTDQKCVAETPAIIDAGFEQIANDKSTDIVLIPGDLVYRGEYQSHVGFREKLYKLRDSGKKIYLITARHDYAEDPVEFDGDKTIPVKGMERDELRDFYREFGFDGAISEHRESMSYVTQLADGIRLLALNCDGDCKDFKGIWDDQMDWALEQIKAAHESGMDIKIALGEYENYQRPDFERTKRINPAYTKIEKTWEEQRLYIKKAIEKLSAEHKKEIESQLDKLIPKEPFGCFEESGEAGREYQIGDNRISFNSFGGVKSLTVGGREIIAENDSPCITYDSYGADDYNYWFTHYSRDLDKTAHWAFADFGKPNIDKIADKYKQGRFAYKLENLTVSQEYNRFSALAELHIDGYFYENLGAPQVFQIKYTLESNRLTAELLWQNKPANRLPESIMLHIYPKSEKISFTKLGRKIDPFDIVKNGNRNIAAVESIELDGVKITNLHSPLVGIGKGKILHFDNEYSPLSDGIAYVLYDNIWGTNFPLWYGDNAYFKYDIEF